MNSRHSSAARVSYRLTIRQPIGSEKVT